MNELNNVIERTENVCNSINDLSNNDKLFASDLSFELDKVNNSMIKMIEDLKTIRYYLGY